MQCWRHLNLLGRFANAWTRLGLTQSLAELPAGLRDSPELVSSSSYATSGSLPSSTSASGGGGGAMVDAAAYAPGSQVGGGAVGRWLVVNCATPACWAGLLPAATLAGFSLS